MNSYAVYAGDVRWCADEVKRCELIKDDVHIRVNITQMIIDGARRYFIFINFDLQKGPISDQRG